MFNNPTPQPTETQTGTELSGLMHQSLYILPNICKQYNSDVMK